MMAMVMETQEPTGGEAFWQQAYRDHGASVLGFLQRRLGQRDLAEDLLQETFIRAIRFDSFQGGNLRGYLISIARHLIINKSRRKQLLVPVETPREDMQPFETVASDEHTPEETTAGTLLHERLGRALHKLKPDHRRAFELAVLEQYSYGEIVETTGWSLARVKSNVHRARKKLIEELGPLAAGRGTTS